MKHIMMFLLFSTSIVLLLGVEVGGHITVDTIWTPEESPYIVTSFLYIQTGVTLTLLPGVEVRIVGASKDDIFNFFWSGNNQPLAKMIVVFGRIVAFGTEDQPITFDVHSEDPRYRWGGMYIYPDSPRSSFEYCTFSNGYKCFVIPGTWTFATVQFDNGSIHMRHCTFIDNLISVASTNVMDDILIYGCKFYAGPGETTEFLGFSVTSPEPPERNFEVTIANCYFTGEGSVGGGGYYTNTLFLNNVYDHVGRGDISSEETRETASERGISSSYGNYTYNGKGANGCGSGIAGSVAFSRRNTIIAFPDSNYTLARSQIIYGARGGTAHISDNYLHGAVNFYTVNSSGSNSMIYNNVMFTTVNRAFDLSQLSSWPQTGELQIFNNLVVSYHLGDNYYNSLLDLRYTHPYVFNNTFSVFFRGSDNIYSGVRFSNNIFHAFTGPPSYGESEDMPNVYSHNCLTSELPQYSSIIDAGGNIVADPLFVDTMAEDYSLQGDSPCIDSGLNLPELPDFDIRYHKRIAPGAADGIRRVDMGAYEYNSVYIGGIRAFVFDAVTGLPLDCVKAVIETRLPEFSDIQGNFHYPTGAGIYTVNLSRWDYEDASIENVLVNEGSDTMLEIPMYREGSSNPGEDGPALPRLLRISNYPNPFNPETSIGYILPGPAHVRLSIYNTRGQKLLTLVDTHQAGGHQSIVWNGRDESGRRVGSGIYFARLETDGAVATRKMMLVK